MVYPSIHHSDMESDQAQAGPSHSTRVIQPLTRTRTEPDVEPAPAAKRQKIQPSKSFADVLVSLNDVVAERGAYFWGRPILPQINEERDVIIFQQIEVEEVGDGSTAALRMFGVTEKGHSVLAHINDFSPYFYVSAPSGLDISDIGGLVDHLNTQARGNCVQHIEMVYKRNLWGYRGEDPTAFLKITVSNPKSLTQIRGIFETGKCSFKGLYPPGQAILTFESNIAYPLRFMTDTKVVGMNWIEVPAGNYKLVPAERKLSTCQIEMSMRWDAFVSHAPEGDWSKVAPLRILSFDIECIVRRDIFPQPQFDPIIQIANMVTRQGEQSPFIRNVFALRGCSPIVGAHVLSFKNEVQMLQAWRNFVEEVDPDIVIGYNTARFDIPYLLDRAQWVGATRFSFLGRIKNLKAQTKDVHFSAKAPTRGCFKETVIEGRLQVDVIQYLQREYNLRNGYKLNVVAKLFLDEKKEDVEISQITQLQNGTPDDRRTLAVYCLKDAYLPQRLLDKLMGIVHYIELARVTGVPFNYLLSRGQSIRVFSLLIRKANEKGYVLPAFADRGSDRQYEAHYDLPTAICDSNPSIMLAHNLCYATLLNQATIDALHLVKDVDYTETPRNGFFVTSSRRKGLIPSMLEDLMSAHERVKTDLTENPDQVRRTMLEGRQLALKVSINSFYAFTKSTIGKLYCPDISISVASYYLQMTKEVNQKARAAPA
ncbi:ribonuclease H-like protein [Leucogyrophana mollusca]|uniref:Ribonuclease H-like protein n=1 Tax=Leucogyrophana mollusca TaxID=85980 RepID=A0ACB8BEQ9_9AGAM|nr:ribonuclease H-like protein [Leucogyrophana mollusca]